MNTSTHPTYGPSPSDIRRVNRMIAWSVGIHVGFVVVASVAPRDWFRGEEPREVMTISLGGTPGPESTGMSSIGGRTVEQVVPAPPRPQPVPPAPPAQEPAPAVVAPAAPPARPVETPRPAAPATRPPTTGPQVARGSSAVDTGAQGEGSGLSFGGGGLGGQIDATDFCCRWYLQALLDRIDANWRKNQREQGETRIRFVVTRAGAITDVFVERSSGSGLLDRASRAALDQTRLPPLPPEYTENTLTIHLTFPYGTTP